MFGDHLDLRDRTHSFPTRRSSDLPAPDRDEEHSTAPPASVQKDRPHVHRRRSGAPRGSVIRSYHPTARRRWRDGGDRLADRRRGAVRSEEHTSELQSLMRISYAGFCLKKKKKPTRKTHSLK